jgi:hypothetical protein
MNRPEGKPDPARQRVEASPKDTVREDPARWCISRLSGIGGIFPPDVLCVLGVCGAHRSIPRFAIGMQPPLPLHSVMYETCRKTWRHPTAHARDHLGRDDASGRGCRPDRREHGPRPVPGIHPVEAVPALPDHQVPRAGHRPVPVPPNHSKPWRDADGRERGGKGNADGGVAAG